jgi:hypothetical protein
MFTSFFSLTIKLNLSIKVKFVHKTFAHWLVSLFDELIQGASQIYPHRGQTVVLVSSNDFE